MIFNQYSRVEGDRGARAREKWDRERAGVGAEIKRHSFAVYYCSSPNQNQFPAKFFFYFLLTPTETSNQILQVRKRNFFSGRKEKKRKILVKLESFA